MANSIIGRDMAVDLGTANTLVYVRGRGILLDEPSVVALNDTTGEVLAVGHDAKRMLGRTPDNITALRPMKDGVIADFEATEQMLRFFIQQVHRRRYLAKPRMVICVPSGITAVEQRAVKEAGYQAGARRVYIIEEPMAAAIGAGLPVHQATGNMVVDVGGGTTEVAVISLGGVVTSLSIRTAGDDLDAAIVAWMKKEYSLLLGDRTAEEVKMTLGSAFPTHDEPEAEIRGRDLVSGLPRTVWSPAPRSARRIEEPLHAIVDAVRSTLDQTPPELAGDIMDRGIVLTGGGALLRGLDERLRHETGMPVHVAEDPLIERVPGRRQVRGGVRGTPAGPGLGASAVLMPTPQAQTQAGFPSRTCRGSSAATVRCALGLDRFDRRADRSRLRSRMVALVLACVTLMALDHQPRHRLAGRAGPAGDGRGLRAGRVDHLGAPSAPSTAVRDWFRTRSSMQHDIARLQAQNSELRAEQATSTYDRNQLAEYDGLTSAAEHPRPGAGAGPRGRHTARPSRSPAP